MDRDTLLDVRCLETVYVLSNARLVKAVDDVSFTIPRGEKLGNPTQIKVNVWYRLPSSSTIVKPHPTHRLSQFLRKGGKS